ncbi:KpsF/GutQ family sugar-phosphate isomerase [Consotaella aegiceratis]|uniref:KpsF/GutQ family sugar-phosphate isomerase n=1 Tax=Consotaella aegiceratis TaxID=3097961 RepID=UPI002F42026A
MTAVAPTTMTATLSAIRTIETEAAGLRSLAKALSGETGASFERTVQWISEVSGRVIVTGIGKSGHVAAKIAATLASTGTPAFFVHPVEAIHGDLGMIGVGDLVLALSWSGESAELRGIVDYTRRFKIPLVAMTAGATSALAGAADEALLLPRATEACPHGLAPTTSTTLQLALGDALAVALLERRGFTPGDFRIFHPGGQLGASLTRVGDIMHTGEALPLVASGTPMAEAVVTMSSKGFGCVAVVDGERLVGIVTDGDLRRHLGENLLVRTVDQVMTRQPKTIGPDTLAAKAMEALNSANITTLMVVVGDRPVGLLHMHDLLRIGVA